VTVEISKLTMSYGDTVALSIPDLHIASVALTALRGPNGSGKSTLLLAMAGLLRPTSGRITVLGVEPGSGAHRQKVSYVPDEPALYDDLTLQDQLDYIARLHKQSEPTDECQRLIGALDAEVLLNKLPRAMSKGQRQKAGLLVGAARPFEVLLLDEPTTALDAASRAQLCEALRALAASGRAIITSTHEDELLEVADTIIDLDEGKLATG